MTGATVDAMFEAERAVAAAATQGLPVNLRGSVEQRSVRAIWLSALLRDPIGPPSVTIENAFVAGHLDLSYAEVPRAVAMLRCEFDTAPCLIDTHLRCLRMSGSVVPGFNAAGVRVDGRLELNERFRCDGALNLEGAHVAGDLRLSNGYFFSPDDPFEQADLPDEHAGFRAVLASRLRVDGSCFCRGARVRGQFRMIGAHIGGLLSFAAASLDHRRTAVVLHGERIDVGESVFLYERFSSAGRIILLNARIAGGLDLHEACFAADGKACLQLNRIMVGRNLNLRAAVVDGGLSVEWANVGGLLRVEKTSFRNGSKIDAAHLCAASLKLDLTTSGDNDSLAAPHPASLPQQLDLTYAQLRTIDIDTRMLPTRLLLNQMTYDAISIEPGASPRQWRHLLDRDDDVHSSGQPYEMLSARLRASGDASTADGIAIAGLRKRRKRLPWPSRVLGVIQDLTVAYGYRTWYALVWLTAATLALSVVFAHWRPTANGEVPAFQPVVYSLDLLVPIIDFKQADGFDAEGWRRWVAWAAIIAGWVLTTAVVSGVTRHITRRG